MQRPGPLTFVVSRPSMRSFDAMKAGSYHGFRRDHTHNCTHDRRLRDMARYESIVDAVGHTPLVRINRIIQSKAKVYGKLEFLNPLASVKDRIGKSMIE